MLHVNMSLEPFCLKDAFGSGPEGPACFSSIFGGCSGRPATPGTCSERRANLTMTEEPEVPRRDLAARSPSQPSVVAPSMLRTCAQQAGLIVEERHHCRPLL